MSKAEEIKLAKQQFAARYPIAKGEKDCARYGVNAAVGRAHLYSPYSINHDIRKYWIEQLISIGEKYKKAQTLKTFESDVLALRESMNSTFPGRFNNGNPDYENGFRIAHAQKSLSIFLKHMWCNNLISALPPVCPIDGVILKYCGSYDSWTKVNSINEYENHLAIVEGKRKKDIIESLPEWEVWAFNNMQSSQIKTDSKKANTWFNVETYYSHKSNGRELVFVDKRFKDCITKQYNAGKALEIQIDNDTIKVKSMNPYSYPSFRQPEINNWAKGKEDDGTIHNGDKITVKARFV